MCQWPRIAANLPATFCYGARVPLPSVSRASVPQPPWREATLWMLLLGAMFVHGYRWSNQWAASQAHTYSLHGGWDDAVPFWAWTIWPYLALNLLYPLTFFLCPTRLALRRHALAIALVQAACLLAFVCWPTGNVRVLPQPAGVNGLLFAQLRAFEAPFNMAPSLHAAVLVLVWQVWRRWLQGAAAWRGLWHAVCGLVLLSTLTTWQHDLLDVLAGLLLGALAWWVTQFVWRPRRPGDLTCGNGKDA